MIVTVSVTSLHHPNHLCVDLESKNQTNDPIVSILYLQYLILANQSILFDHVTSYHRHHYKSHLHQLSVDHMNLYQVQHVSMKSQSIVDVDIYFYLVSMVTDHCNSVICWTHAYRIYFKPCIHYLNHYIFQLIFWPTCTFHTEVNLDNGNPLLCLLQWQI